MLLGGTTMAGGESQCWAVLLRRREAATGYYGQKMIVAVAVVAAPRSLLGEVRGM